MVIIYYTAESICKQMLLTFALAYFLAALFELLGTQLT